MECVSCDKELFLSTMLARNAAYLYNLVFGKRYYVYECPRRAGDYHLTTHRQYKRTAALKPL